MAYNNINAQANKAYVSALDSLLDTREIDHNVYDIWRENDFTDILNLADRKRPVKQLTAYYSWVNDQLFKKFDTTAQTVTGTGTRTITATSTAATQGFVRKGDLAIFPDGNSAIAQSVTTGSGKDTVVWKGVSGGNITSSAGDAIWVYSYAGGERADAPANKTFGFSKYSNRIQIFQESDSITDVQNASTLETTINGKDVYVVKSHLDKLKILKGGINAAMIAGDISDTAFSDGSPALVDQNQPTGGGGGGATQTTRGLDKWVSAYGTLATANGGTANGAVLLADLASFGDSLTAKRAPEEQLVLSSKAVRRGFDNLIKGLNSAGITSVRLNVDGKELDTMVDKFSYGGYSYNFATLPICDHPMFGSTPIAKSAYFVPLNGRVPLEGGGEAPCMGVAYSPANYPLGNEMIGETQSGAIAPLLPSGHIAEFKTSWTSKQGFDVKTPTFLGRMIVVA